MGLILSWPFVAVGGAITALSVYLWIKAASADYERLPREIVRSSAVRSTADQPT